MKNIVSLSIYFLSIIGYSQSFESIFSNVDYQAGQSVCQTTDGGYVVAGHRGSPANGSEDIWLIKLNVFGEIVWEQTFCEDPYHSGRAYSVQQTSDGGYILTGKTIIYTTGNGYEVFLIKTDSLGNVEWEHMYIEENNDWATEVIQTSDGGYIMTGITNSYGAGQTDVWLLKTDSNGELEWTNTYGGVGYEKSYSIVETFDGGFVITGDVFVSSSNYDLLLIKINSQGELIWSRTYGGENIDCGRSILQSSDGSFVTAGYTYSYGNSQSDCYILKTDNYGIELWSKTFGFQGNDYGYSIQETKDYGYIITGASESSLTSGLDVCLIKTNINGDEEWLKFFGGELTDLGYCVQQTTDDGYIVAGMKNGGFGYTGDMYVIKTDSEGNALSTSVVDLNNSSNRKLVRTIDFLGRNSKEIYNTPLIDIYNDGSAEKKIVVDR